MMLDLFRKSCPEHCAMSAQTSWLEPIGLVVTVTGLVLVVLGAWLLLRIDPSSPRYSVGGLRAPGSVGNVFRDQKRPTALLLVGSAVQVVGAAMSLVGH